MPHAILCGNALVLVLDLLHDPPRVFACCVPCAALRCAVAIHSGRLSLQEFVSGCVVLGIRLPREQAERAFREMDVDGGGFILFDEFCAWCVQHQASAGRAHDDEDDDDQEDSDDSDADDEEEGSEESSEDEHLLGSIPDRGAM